MRQVSNFMLLLHDNFINQKFYLCDHENLTELLMMQLKLCLKLIHLILPVQHSLRYGLFVVATAAVCESGESTDDTNSISSWHGDSTTHAFQVRKGGPLLR